MLCIHCENPARGVCSFCGRALCRDHQTQKLPSIVTIFVGDGSVPKAVVVSDVLWCGICKPQPEPIEMPELY